MSNLNWAFMGSMKNSFLGNSMRSGFHGLYEDVFAIILVTVGPS
ncbi:hypothetical protein ACFSFW_12000 [Fredinandcohnia salidurans]|uniref:Uncharacterized protein n=1 Tax=Fredinandcohnia salidurans TaxID=2595041 RepID=A0ABW4MQL4_9BACI